MPGACRRGSLEDLADSCSHITIADFVQRYRSSPAALNVVNARFAVSNQMLRSGVQVSSLHLHKYARDCKEGRNEAFKKKDFQAAPGAYELAIAAYADDLVFHNNKVAVFIEELKYRIPSKIFPPR